MYHRFVNLRKSLNFLSAVSSFATEEFDLKDTQDIMEYKVRFVDVDVVVI